MPVIPTVESLRTSTLRHRFGDVFNPPGLTNFWGSAQASLDVSGLRSIAFPPITMGEVGIAGQGGGVTTGDLFLDGEYAMARGNPVDFAWQPDLIDRRQIHGDLEVSTTTITPLARTAVAERIEVRNTGTAARTVEVKLALHGNVTKLDDSWGWAQAPADFDNSTTVDAAAGTVAFESRRTAAACVQGCWPPPDRVAPGYLAHTVTLQPGETWSTTFTVALGDNLASATQTYDTVARGYDVEAQRIRDEWNAQLSAAFTPDNDRFSGHLPTLDTDDADLLRLYHTALISLLVHKRTSPASLHGPTYVTLSPRYWQTTTFLWDISLAAPLLAQLDPTALREMTERWMEINIHQHFGTDFLTGKGVGPWYSVNDYAMCRMAAEYLRWTGDVSWLDNKVGDSTVLDHLVSYATNWRSLRRRGHKLADYGGVDNLLEAVGSYTNEVAGLNAANVSNLRFVADLLADRGRTAEAGALRREATRLLRNLNDLYVDGEGVWQCRLPDGAVREVRHCYDFATVLTTVGNDLKPTQRREMVEFFRRELQTPTWMRALSARDLDATFSARPDHQWTGAYAAWPAIALNALYVAGEATAAREWMRGLAQTMRQGPVAQAYFAEDVFPPEPGAGALKAPSDAPWINDWSCVSGAAFHEPILAGLFGVRAGIFGGVTARPVLSGADRRARLLNLRHQGRDYDVDAGGVHPQSRSLRGSPHPRRAARTL